MANGLVNQLAGLITKNGLSITLKAFASVMDQEADAAYSQGQDPALEQAYFQLSSEFESLAESKEVLAIDANAEDQADDSIGSEPEQASPGASSPQGAAPSTKSSTPAAPAVKPDSADKADASDV